MAFRIVLWLGTMLVALIIAFVVFRLRSVRHHAAAGMDALAVVRLVTLIVYGLAAAWWAYCIKWSRFEQGGHSERVSEQTYRLAGAANVAAGILFVVVQAIWVFGLVR